MDDPYILFALVMNAKRGAEAAAVHARLALASKRYWKLYQEFVEAQVLDRCVVGGCLPNGMLHGMQKCGDGNHIMWRWKDRLHRENDEPAVIWDDGTREWWVRGQRHRKNDQPAVIWADGTQEWWWQNQRHRENDQPAVIFPDGMRAWVWMGQKHRFISADGLQAWYWMGQRHRENDEPAVIGAGGERQWWVNGKQIR